MDTTFWIGIFVGTAFSLVASIIANLYTDRIQQYLSARRSIRLNNKKTSELTTYAFVKKLRAGDPVSTLSFGRSRDFTFYMLGFAVLSGVVCLVVIVDPTFDRSNALYRFLPILLIALSLTCLMALLLSFQSVARISKKANDFEQYEANIRSKWGNDAI